MQDYQPIPSFQLDHDTMQPGLYCLGISHGVYTYDLRFKRPNAGDYVSTAAMHSLEHMFATVIRNSDCKDDVIYFGPMGCRTGCYLLLYQIPIEQAKPLIIRCLQTCLQLDHVPGCAPIECGNCADHDLQGARAEIRAYLDLLQSN